MNRVLVSCLCFGLAALLAHAEDGADRETRVRAGFEANVRQAHARFAPEIDRLTPVRFELSPQLLLPGETATLNIQVQAETPPNAPLEVWETCYDAEPKISTVSLEWKQAAPGQPFTAQWQGQPKACGNYLLHWRCDGIGDIPEFWRNFAVADAGWAVMIVNSTSHIAPRPEPEFHRLHLPFSYWAEALLYGPRNSAEDFAAFSRNARQFGDDPGLLIFMGGDYLPEDKTVFCDEAESTQRAILQCYQELWGFCRFPRPLDSLYTYGMGNGPARLARSLGISLLGALCADQNWGDGPFKINHWGMPARPYFVSGDDFRKPGQGGPKAMVGMQQCERQSLLCRDNGCVYSFESGIAYAFDQYSGITRPRVINDMILSREADFLECFLDAAAQAPQPYLFGCGFEFNGVWPAMADINRHFMEMLVQRARSAPLVFTTATAAADFMRAHNERIPESLLYLCDVFAGMTNGGKAQNAPDSIEIENAAFRALFRRGELLPYAQYDYTTPWNYPDWGNENIPRRPDGYIIPGTNDRFRVTPSIVDTRPFNAVMHAEEQENATHIIIEVNAARSQHNLALALWDIPREFSKNAADYQVHGAKRFVPLRAAYTENLCGLVIADLHEGANQIEVVVTSPRRAPLSIDFKLNDAVNAKVFERDGTATAYLYNLTPNAADVRYTPVEGISVALYPFDSDEPRPLTEPGILNIEPGKCQRLSGLTREALPGFFSGASPLSAPVNP